MADVGEGCGGRGVVDCGEWECARRWRVGGVRFAREICSKGFQRNTYWCTRCAGALDAGWRNGRNRARTAITYHRLAASLPAPPPSARSGRLSDCLLSSERRRRSPHGQANRERNRVAQCPDPVSREAGPAAWAPKPIRSDGELKQQGSRASSLRTEEKEIIRIILAGKFLCRRRSAIKAVVDGRGLSCGGEVLF